MRFIAELPSETRKLLRRVYRESQRHRVRARAQCILLSAQGYTTTQLMEIFEVDRITLYNWFNAWESRGVAGLYDRPGKGRKPKLTSEQKQQIKAWSEVFPKHLGKICALIEEGFGISVSRDTVKRVLKAFQCSWRRIRRKVNGEPDPEEYQAKLQELEGLRRQAHQDEIDLRYVDESGFCLVPYVPYAWQQKGKTIEIQTSKSKRLNVVGLLSQDNALDAYTFEGSITSEVVIASIDEFCKTRDPAHKTVIVLDNAPIHTSEALEEKISQWEAKGIELFYLPKYSPQLNLIELLWRFMKYEWIEFSAYLSWHHLVEYVEHVIKNYGTQYRINFA
jgi:transposase